MTFPSCSLILILFATHTHVSNASLYFFSLPPNPSSIRHPLSRAVLYTTSSCGQALKASLRERRSCLK